MEVKSVKEVHTELLMHSVRFAKDEQGRRKGQDVLFKWPEIEKNVRMRNSTEFTGLRLNTTPSAQL